jgi:L-seryl-tRNA(Ser) seleniumtransferase
MDNLQRKLPSVDKVLSEKKIQSIKIILPHHLVVDLVRETLDYYRSMITTNNISPSLEEIVNKIIDHAQALIQPSLKHVINATGVVLHTNLGRAPLSEDSILAMSKVSSNYCNIEFDLEAGERGDRHSHIESLLCRLTGAESGMVVNNNASAVLLGLSAIAKKKEVLISRGQAVEIGGGFRIPEVMKQSGTKLVEVGTTNCTYIHDYTQAYSPKTAALMRVHPSNFRVVGFTHFVTLEEMIDFAKTKEILMFDDLGSGCLLDTSKFGLELEPTVQESIAKGTDLAFFSGDKLLGGPQAGIIVGKKILIDRLKKHPLTRAIRIDKTRLAGLLTTLMHYLKDEAISKIPIWQMISLTIPEIERRANLWAESLGDRAKVVDGESVIGGGSLPGATLPSRLLAVGHFIKADQAQIFARKLYHQNIPIISRISQNTVLLDPRTVSPKDDPVIIRGLRQAIQD